MYNFFFGRSINTYGRIRTSYSSYMKASHNVLYTKKHIQTYVSYPAMDISCITSKERGVELELEGVRYNYRDASRTAYILGPPPSRGEISN